MLAFLILALAYLLDETVSAPLSQTKSAAGYTSWQPEPQVRGTFRLIVSCLITLSLCVWTAVHLNIPSPATKDSDINVGRFRRWRSNYAFRRTRWVILGILAPEIVVYSAWKQWRSARALTSKIKKLAKQVCTHAFL
jgi:hypothetical protein